MTIEANYVQWAKDAEGDGEHARAAEFWRRAGAVALADGRGDDAQHYEASAQRAYAPPTGKPSKHRTGRRTIRGDAGKGIIVMEFCPPNLVTFREKGRRKRYPTNLAALFDFARRLEARRIQDERVKARKLRRK